MNRHVLNLTGPFLLLASIFLLTCKEYSYEGGNIAQYTFIGSADACSGSLLSGQYYKGVALSTDNKNSVQVDVTKPGRYNITTETINGIRFYSSGEFASTGIQTVVLQGSGTPITDGNFTFTLPGPTGCKFLVTVNPKPVINAVYSLAGAPDNCQDPAFSGRIIKGLTLTSDVTLTLKVQVTSPGAFNITTDTVDGIYYNGSGTFTAAGSQTVTLRGFGRPDKSGNYYFKTSTGSSTCIFKLGVMSPEPSATYVLESGSGNPPPCVHVVEGNYNKNVALTTSNIVTLRVYVTVPGNFTVSTDAVNGMIFFYEGTFTSTGVQYISLVGTGTPIATGTFAFTPEIVGPHPIGGEICGFTIVVN